MSFAPPGLLVASDAADTALTCVFSSNSPGQQSLASAPAVSRGCTGSSIPAPRPTPPRWGPPSAHCIRCRHSPQPRLTLQPNFLLCDADVVEHTGMAMPRASLGFAESRLRGRTAMRWSLDSRLQTFVFILVGPQLACMHESVPPHSCRINLSSCPASQCLTDLYSLVISRASVSACIGKPH